MTRGLVRIADFFSRFLVAVENIGLRDAIRLFFLQRVTRSRRDSKFFIRSLKRDFHARGYADVGVISHFYRPGYRIEDVPSHRVRFIVDAGANIGDETVRFRFFHPDATIVAIEPASDNFRLLELNTAADPKIHRVHGGLWSKDCLLQVASGPTNEGFRVSEVRDGQNNQSAVPAISVETILQRFQASEIDILKLDIEGSEFELFSSHASGWIRNVKVFIFECPDNDRPGTTMVIFDALKRLDLEYRCFVIGENIVLIRADVPWTLRSVLYYDRTAV
jgi:FkbM family methyltransferase